MTVEFAELDRLVGTTDPLGHVTQQAYDALGNRTVMTDAAGLVTRYHYDGLNRLMAVIEHWDGNSACVPSAQAVADNLCTQYVYDALGNRVVITNALAVSTTLTLYDSLNRPVLVADALGHRTQSAYDALGNRTVMTDANGATTYYAYDGLNRLVTTTYTADNEVVVFTYDALGNRTAMQDGLGTTSYVYDELNRLITVTSPFTGVVGYGYDLVGNRTRLTYPDGRQVTYDYDGDHRLITVTSWLTGTASYAYDPAGRLTNLYHESAMGLLLANYAYELDQVGNRLVATETLRLPEGLTAAQRLPDDATGADQALPAVAGNTAGYLTVWQDERDGPGWAIYGQRTSHEGTPVGSNLVITDTGQTPAVAAGPESYLVVWESAGEIWATFVDNAGQVEASFVVAGTGGANPAGQPDVVYDPTNDIFLVAWRREPSPTGSETYLIQARTVSPAGSLGTVRTLATQLREMLAPAVAVNDSGTFLVVWQDRRNGANYDIQAQRLTASGLTGSNFAITSGNPNDQLPDVAWNSLAEVFLVVWHDNQDIWARPVNSNDTFPNAAYRVYDTTTTNPAAQAAVTGRQDTATFLVAWRQQTSIGYRIDAQEVTLTTTVGSPVNLAAHTLNLAAPAVATTGNEAQLVAWQQQPSSEQDIYARAIRPGLIQTTTITYDYDPLYRLRTAVYTGAITATYEYAYDGVGNRLIFSRTITTTQVTTYTYNAANQLVTARLNTSPDTWYYEYDNNGNQLRQVPNGLDPAAGEVRYTFDQRNLLVQIENHDGSSYQVQAEIVYDGAGNRLRTVAYLAGVPMTTTYTLDPAGGGRPLAAEAGGAETLFLYGLFGIGEYDTEGRYYLGDAQLSVRQLLDEAGSVLLARTYAPFGLLLQQQGGGNALYGYAGSLSGGGGLLYVNGRYFDPSTGRFLSPDNDFDPLQPSRSLNGYIISMILSNPAGLLFGPLLVLNSRGRKRSRKMHYSLWLLLGISLGLGLVGCQGNDDEDVSGGNGTPEATEIEQGGEPQSRPTPQTPGARQEPPTPTARSTATAELLATAVACPTPFNGVPPTTAEQPTATIGPTQELATLEQRLWAAEQAVLKHHGAIPSSLVLAIAAAESGRDFGWNNTNQPTLDGYPALGNDDGIMQVTEASGHHQASGPYTNTIIGIEANIKDGVATLLEFLDAVRLGFGDYGDAFNGIPNEELVRTSLHYNGGNAPISLYNAGFGAPGYLARVGDTLGNYVPQTFGVQYENDGLAQDLYAGQAIVCNLIDPGLTVPECP